MVVINFQIINPTTRFRRNSKNVCKRL